MSLVIERSLERAPWAAASVAAVGEPSRAPTVAARPQQKGAVVVAAQVLVPRNPH
jgi:hypothetical protein